MSGRTIMIAMLAFATVFGAALWYWQTRGHYYEVTDVSTVAVSGAEIEVSGYRGIDADTSPLKMRGCFRVDTVPEGPAAPDADPLVAPGWFDCFDARAIAADLTAGDARAILAEANAPYGFDRIVAVYPDLRAYQWRQINRCGRAVFEGDPLPDGCPAPRN